MAASLSLISDMAAVHSCSPLCMPIHHVCALYRRRWLSYLLLISLNGWKMGEWHALHFTYKGGRSHYILTPICYY